MKKRIVIWAFILLLFSCGGKGPLPEETGTGYKVAVIFPETEWGSVRPAVEWAAEEARKVYPGIRLVFEWIDESGADFTSKVKAVTHDNSYAAIIGPEYSNSARYVAQQSLSYRIPVLMPMVTSTEFQRIYAETNKTEPNIFCLAQNDAAQLEAVITKAKQNGIKTLFMLCRSGEDDEYSASFERFYYFICKEAGMQEYFYGNFSDNNVDNLAAWMEVIVEMMPEYEDSGLFFVPSSLEDMRVFDRIMQGYAGNPGIWPVLCADIANEPSLEGQLKAGVYEGFSLGATSAFEKAWKERFGAPLPGGYAQLFDCVSLVAVAASKVEEGSAKTVREALESLLIKGSGYSGASGNIHFPEDAPIAPEEVIYQNWYYENGKFGIRASAPHHLERGWDWSAMHIDDIDDSDVPDDSSWYGPLEDHYALIVATSTGWNNYRHQADALAMYQMLKGFGYTDDKIILIMEDDVANYPSNPYPGEVRVLPGGPDLREGAVIDYYLSSLAPEDLLGIFSGEPSEKTPVVIEGGIGTNVLVFWSGHGVRNDELKWGEDTITSDMIEVALVRSSTNFRKLFFVMDTCYSGSIPKYCTSTGLLFLCSAAEGEPSHADVYDEVCGTYLSNGFTRAFRSAVEANPSLTLEQLYKEVARETTGSHAGIYNYYYYGSLTRNTFREYLP